MRKMSLFSSGFRVVLIWVFFCGAPGSWGYAASVRQVAMDEMIQNSRLVFEGKVISLESVKTGSRRIHTYVTFSILDVIKGDYSQDTVTLRFLGGTVGNVTMGVSDMKFPGPGEHGIYFVESLEKSQVNPLYGWSQGHFLVEPDQTGMNRVLTRGRAPVTAVVRQRSAEQVESGTTVVPPLSKGVASGIVAGQNSMEQNALTTDEFKRDLKNIMERLDD